MRMLFRYILFLVLAILANSCKAEPKGEFETIEKQIAEVIMENPSDSIIDSILKLLNEDGSFTDIEYDSEVSSKWTPQYHMYRLFTLASAFANRQNRHYKEVFYKECLMKGLNAWIQKAPHSKNWWYGEILIPQKVGGILLVMRACDSALPADMENVFLQIMKESTTSPYDYNDANRTDVALHWIYRGCLTKDPNILNNGVNCIYEVLDVGETGFQEDGSFFHDGPQLFIGGYCTTAILGIMDTAVSMRGTSYSLNVEKLCVLRDYFLHTFPCCIQGGILNYDVVGRAITEKDYLLANVQHYMTGLYEKMSLIDEDNAEQYTRLIPYIKGNTSLDISSHVHFYRGDYTVHVRPNYKFHTRFYSDRTQKCESGLGQNLRGYFLCDGNTGLTKTGREYYNIMPLWDWNYVPGTTTPIMDEVPSAKRVYGIASFVGGCSDSLYGVSTCSYYDDRDDIKTGANKGYFFFDDEIVCLGTNISSEYDAVTTVEQCWAKDHMFIKGNDGFNQISGIFKTVDKISAVIHNDVGYYFPDQGNILCEIRNAEGNWKLIDNTQKDTLVKGNVFMLQIKHDLGVSTGKNYSYIIIPSTTPNKMMEYITRSDVEIIANTEDYQAVRHKTLNIWELIFYKGCTLSHKNMKITADRPCAMIYKIKNDGSDPELFVADPSQTGEDINVIIEDNVLNRIYNSTIRFNNLPTKEWGKTQQAFLNLSSNNIHKREIDNSIGILSIFDLNGRKVKEIDDFDELYNWIILKERRSKQLFFIYSSKGKRIKTIL